MIEQVILNPEAMAETDEEAPNEWLLGYGTWSCPEPGCDFDDAGSVENLMYHVQRGEHWNLDELFGDVDHGR